MLRKIKRLLYCLLYGWKHQLFVLDLNNKRQWRKNDKKEFTVRSGGSKNIPASSNTSYLKPQKKRRNNKLVDKVKFLLCMLGRNDTVVFFIIQPKTMSRIIFSFGFLLVSLLAADQNFTKSWDEPCHVIIGSYWHETKVLKIFLNYIDVMTGSLMYV